MLANMEPRPAPGIFNSANSEYAGAALPAAENERRQAAGFGSLERMTERWHQCRS
jgi:hypothetical protein